MRIAIIGANSFIGRAVCNALDTTNHEVVAILRDKSIENISGAQKIVHIDDAGPEQDWQKIISNIDVIVQLTSPKAVDNPRSSQRLDYERVIDRGTVAIGKAALTNKLKRMIFISSVKVNGEFTDGKPFAVDSLPNPKTAYAENKLKAEHGLAILSKKGLPVTIIRPPIVYGPGNTGNIGLLIKLLSLSPGWCVPLKEIKNERSLIFVDNLSSAIISSIEDPTSESRLFFARDSEMLSTSQLCMALLEEMGKSKVLGRDPLGFVRKTLSFCVPGLAVRLYESLQMDDSAIKETLNWHPPYSVYEGLSRTVEEMKQE
ncbi:MAG: hypothetical protein CMM58_11930 [Rhodospirillaceae bacterium]|nr:hypothetical protein [Rhodospirillaceae bacterium]